MNSFKYTFELESGAKKSFQVNLDPETLSLVLAPAEKPAWTKLSFCQCSCCPLPRGGEGHCPVAVNISSLVREFGDIISVTNAVVTVETDERVVSKKTSIAEGLYSLLGLYMATSGCPILNKLKPMAANHLPFAAIEETVYRVVTMYCAAQYFRMKNGKAPDWELARLTAMYEAIRCVNTDFSARLREAAKEDSLLNSLVNLDVFAMVMTEADASAHSIEHMFRPFMAD